MHLYWLDLVGVFAFAFLGARAALQHRLNYWGVLLCAFLTALGGGTIRAILLNRTPLYFYNRTYIVTVLLGMVISSILFRSYTRIRIYIVLLDALGMVVFAYSGAHAAANANLGLLAMVLFAVLTAVGGGIISDLLLHQPPRVLQGSGWYALPPVLVGWCYWFGGDAMRLPVVTAVLLVSAWMLQAATTLLPGSKLQRRILHIARKHARILKKQWIALIVPRAKVESSPEVD